VAAASSPPKKVKVKVKVKVKRSRQRDVAATVIFQTKRLDKRTLVAKKQIKDQPY
jgi:hypothetical protein